MTDAETTASAMPPSAPPAPPAATGNAAAYSMAASKVYGQGDTAVNALREVSVQFDRGRFTAIMGPSGSGKSTLMQCMAGLDRLTGGETFVGDVALSGLSDKALTELRRDKIGFIFQAFNLIPTLDAQENMTLPLDLAGGKVDTEWFNEVVQATGLADRLDHRPNELSGGQQQRVAVARALASRPDIIFGDEPTGNLDSKTAAEILEFMRRAVDELGQTIVMVTHDPVSASYSDHVLFLRDGRIVDEMPNPTSDAVFDRIKTLEG
ncbi:MAG: ABC transporter ATP-binding protein [Actinomycetota bacterium]